MSVDSNGEHSTFDFLQWAVSANNVDIEFLVTQGKVREIVIIFETSPEDLDEHLTVFGVVFGGELRIEKSIGQKGKIEVHIAPQHLGGIYTHSGIIAFRAVFEDIIALNEAGHVFNINGVDYDMGKGRWN